MSDKPMNENKEIQGTKEQKEIVLTEGNWKFLKGIQQGLKVYEAYKLAGYEGTSPNSAYVLYNSLKKKFQDVVNADGFDKLRLSLDFQKLLSLPLEQSKTEVTLNEALKIRRLAHTIMNDNEQKSPQASFTMIVIESGQAPKIIENISKVIDAEVIKQNEGEASNEQLT